MARKSTAGQKKNVSSAGKSSLSKHDVLAHVWQFVHYVEDFIVGSKQWPSSTCKKKCDQVKQVLRDAE